MFPEHFTLLVAALAAGFGLTLIGLINVLAGPVCVPVRLIAGALGCAASLAVAVFVAGPAAGWMAGLVLVGGIVVCAAVGTRHCRAVATAVTRPAVRWGLLSAAGLAVVASGVAHFEATEQAICDNDFRHIAIVSEAFQSPITDYVSALTDRGNRIELGIVTPTRDPVALIALEEDYLRRNACDFDVIRRKPADALTNCHGWVFTNGRYHVGGAWVDQILTDNEYVAVADPQPGDLVVYRRDEQVVHTAVVRYVTEGQPVLVEGKWGGIGVFLHAVDQSCYGADFTYYRSPRPGHILDGLGTDMAPRVVAGGGGGGG